MSDDAFSIHEDSDYFRAAIAYTATVTGFAASIIEKDYFCSLLLKSLALPDTIVFKGGTCLSKIITDFFRMSEDLDFTASLPAGANRKQRRQYADQLRRSLSALPAPFEIAEPLRGFNQSMQYALAVRYQSLLQNATENILVELSVREPLLRPPQTGKAKTILLNPVTGESLLPVFDLSSMDPLEVYAEKFRAALSRREVAIRDFFDLDYAVRVRALDPVAPALVELVRMKLAIPGNGPVRVSAAVYEQLRNQLEKRLGSVLRTSDFLSFDLRRAFDIVTQMARALQSP